METSTLAAGGGGGGGTNSTTRDPKELLTIFVRDCRILECRFCKKNKGVQGKETKVVSCYPECGRAGDTQEDTVGSNVNWLDFLTECKPLDCHRCGRPMGFMHKASEDFYCGPRCQTEQKKVLNASSIRRDNNSSRAGNTTILPIDQGRRKGGNNNNAASAPPAATTTMATQTSNVEVKPNVIQIASLTAVTWDEPLSGNIAAESTSSTSVAAVATAPKPNPPLTAQEKQKKRRPDEPSSTSSTASVSKGPKTRTQMQKKPSSETKSDRTSSTKKRMTTVSKRTCCGKIFNDCCELKTHTYNHHMSVEQRREERKKWTFRCQVCSQRFRAKSGLAAHYRSIHMKKTVVKSCEMCGQLCLNATELMEHLTSHMTPEQSKRQRYCPICRQWFEKRKSLLFHTIRYHVYEKK